MPDPSESQQYCSRCLTTFTGDPKQCTNLGCRRKRPVAGWGRIYEPGEVFDRTYRIHQMLAVGGAGVTYVARELDAEGEETGPKLAVKILLAARDQGPYVRRLATEAQIIQELDHPNIVQYLGFVHRSGHSPYLITRFESGGSLLDHMRRVGVLSVKQAAVIGRQICRALEKGHERGIVHRDLKPENVLLAEPVPKGEDPVVRVADFGIAKVTGSLGGGNTRVGAFVGTPHYAAPEQFVGGAVSEMADVYSVGAMLYFCMTASHVVRFADRLDPEDSFQLLCDSLPVVVRRDQDPPADVERINAILAVAMAVDPGQRCGVVQLDSMLEALIADRDPVITECIAEPLSGETAIAAASVTGVAGVVDAEARAPVSPPGPSAVAPPPPSTPSAAQGPPPAADPRTSTEARAPVPSPPPATRGSGRGLLVAVALVTLVGIGAALAWALVGVSPTTATEAPLEDGELPIELTGQESGRDAQVDYAGIQRSADNLSDWLAEVCSPSGGDTARVELVIEASGRVREAESAGGDAVGACVATKITRAEFKRSGARAVRVDLSWAW